MESDNRTSEASGSVSGAESETVTPPNGTESLLQAELQKAMLRPIGKHPAGHLCKWCDRIRKQLAQAAVKESQGKRVTRQQLKPSQRAFIKHYTNPNSPGFGKPKQAAILAGKPSELASGWAASTLQKDTVQTAMVAALERHGITDDLIAAKLLEGMNATIISRVKHEGSFTDERVDADFHARAKYVEMTGRMKGSFPRESEAPPGAMVIQVPTEAQEIAVGVRISTRKKSEE